MKDWDKYDIHTKLGAPINWEKTGINFPRKKSRTMGPVAQLAVRASEIALTDAGLLDGTNLSDGSIGVAYGSSWGSIEPVLGFTELLQKGTSSRLNATSYVQMMSHTTAVNIGMYFGLTGRIIPTSSACTSGSQAIGYAYESIKWGRADVMVAGGAEELSVTESAVFDTLFATSCRNDAPETTPRPFDRDRDGLVLGEGAGTLILEDLDHANARGARIYAEVVGFGTNSDGNHITQPQASTMEVALKSALQDASLSPEQIGFVSAHGTATEFGDIAETTATAAVLGNEKPIHSLKGYFGHTLGACGAIEAWLSIEMMRENWFVPTANLENVDSRCAGLDYIINVPRRLEIEHVMSNNFAFGGINTSLIFKRTSI
jgi:3-oxoacyl-[acyl-carrier-protein] synthase II